MGIIATDESDTYPPVPQQFCMSIEISMGPSFKFLHPASSRRDYAAVEHAGSPVQLAVSVIMAATLMVVLAIDWLVESAVRTSEVAERFNHLMNHSRAR
jgi:hypothetical protein